MFNKAKAYLAVLCVMFTVSIASFAWAKEDKNKLPFKIGVNKFAWYASLQTINFMPLISADPFSGVILTDWYSINTNERYKVNIYILEENLTSQTVQVRVFKQRKNGNMWEDVQVPSNMGAQIEDSILNTARELRIEHMTRSAS